jgi:hypothetical protein
MISNDPNISSSVYEPANRVQTDSAVRAIIPQRDIITIKVNIDDLEAASAPVSYLRIRIKNGYTATVNLNSGHLSVMRGKEILESGQFDPEVIIGLINQRLKKAFPTFHARPLQMP